MGGALGPRRHYWLRAAPPSPAAGQHVRAGKGAGFKFENPGDGGGVRRGIGPQCASAGGGGGSGSGAKGLVSSQACHLPP